MVKLICYFSTWKYFLELPVNRIVHIVRQAIYILSFSFRTTDSRKRDDTSIEIS